jgi:hypothetical protein
MTEKSGFWAEFLVDKEVLDIFGHGYVVVAFVVGAIAMVSEVLNILGC